MFIVSLAIADLIVGLVVMPMSTVYIFTGDWMFGVGLCQLWIGVDYTASTASILNLFILSLDRYWSVTMPLKYLSKRTTKRALIMISLVRCVAFFVLRVSISPSSVLSFLTLLPWLSARSRSLTTIFTVLLSTLICPQPPSSEKHSPSHTPNRRATVFFSFLLLVSLHSSFKNFLTYTKI